MTTVAGCNLYEPLLGIETDLGCLDLILEVATYTNPF